jgi:1,2-diacylglycerol 3-alpha-glucosyltransferase
MNTEVPNRRPRPRPTKVYIVCTGLGKVRRGFETHARDLFDRLRSDGQLDVTLLKGGGSFARGEVVIPNFHRDSWINRAICSVAGVSKRFYIEYLSFCATLGPLVRLGNPDVIYTLEAPIYKFLLTWRKLTRGRYRLVHTTSGQLADIPSPEGTFIHHCTPCYVTKANALGFPKQRQYLIPQFLDLSVIPRLSSIAEKKAIRSRLGIPEHRKVVLSVGSLDKSVKRMDYVIREVSSLRTNGSNDTYLILLGQQDPETPEIVKLAEQLVGDGNFRIGTVSRTELWDYYRAADVFALASLKEGFGFVYIEALASGLPVIAHDYDVARYVLSTEATFADLEAEGALAEALDRVLTNDSPQETRVSRRRYVEQRFDWHAVGRQYVKMFEEAASV